ncbi:STAS domain-containing protein [Couchioplanes caeruleus]|uniref:STAS domain-containing protein n=1 Tax=Couchioplanes caeruleus subsp. caeruleus TaxID=56427 RepID=A0A1K0GTR8_9ACTN|nr:STAS domain-containing protein [Couchioplanes caeruleus]OJF15870.1 hypothetical protein BG844_02065 [Couchioplanes caeruleus subsp. caeruleus]
MIGDLDASAVAGFHAKVTPLVAPPARIVELDLVGVGFCDVAGGRELLMLRCQAARQQIRLDLVAAHPAVWFLLHLLDEQAWLLHPGQQ